ncbi:putative nuclease HARBI1 [Tachysurus ichikawai]
MASIVHCYHRFGGRGYSQRVYVGHAQPLEQYTTEELYTRFRFGKADIKYIADLVRPKLQRRTRRSHSLSVEEQVLIGLRFYASGTFYQVVGDNIMYCRSGQINSTTPAQARFNTAHCKTRCAIERLNGVLKRCFACLNYLRVEPQGACNIILACILLHNIATRCNVPLCDDVYDAPEPVEEPGQPLAFCPNEGLTGHIVRDAIVRHYF